ncbi:MAG: hypothetical protein HY097_05200 [Nitrospinae bacterium]|nr:hypothetical protein [Nitrospinota bacterium]MBI3815499.1 hypothetical protein [Nitrospinota bacterium]
MSAVGNIPDIRQNIIETAHQQRRSESASVYRGERSGRELVKEGFSKYENIRGALRSAVKEDALRNIRGQDETRAEQEAKAKQVKLNLAKERRHDTIREKFVVEEGKGTGISIAA